MKSKSKIFIVIILLLQLVINIYLIVEKENIQELKEETTIPVRKPEKALSMMLETEAGSGNYELTTASSWPTEGYIFNSTLSKCENGGELSWDGTNKKVLMSGNMSDKCYVYFDKEASTISFTIDGTVYNAEEGMLWNEWVDSIYNTGGFNIKWHELMDYNIIVNTSANAIANFGDYEPLNASTAIISGYNYQLIWNKKTIPNYHGIVFFIY